MSTVRIGVARIFSGFFLAVAFLLMGVMVFQLISVAVGGKEIAPALLGAISTAVVALATFELGVGIGHEHRVIDGENVYSNVRRTATRFIGVVSIALVLEALMLVIKYSQLELAGNLYYPVAIMAGAGFLLMSLGVFLRLTRPDSAALHDRLAPQSGRETPVEPLRQRAAVEKN